MAVSNRLSFLALGSLVNVHLLHPEIDSGFYCISGVGIIEPGPEFAQLDGTSKLNSQADLMFDIQKRAVGHRD